MNRERVFILLMVAFIIGFVPLVLGILKLTENCDFVAGFKAFYGEPHYCMRAQIP